MIWLVILPMIVILILGLHRETGSWIWELTLSDIVPDYPGGRDAFVTVMLIAMLLVIGWSI